MYENDFFYAETPVPDVKFHVWNIQIHTSIQQRPSIRAINSNSETVKSDRCCLLPVAFLHKYVFGKVQDLRYDIFAV